MATTEERLKALEEQVAAINSALSDIAMAADGGPCDQHRGHGGPGGHDAGHREPETKAVPGTAFGAKASFLAQEIKDRSTTDSLHMLLSLILDLWRRHEYIYLSLQNRVLGASQDRTAMIAAHSELLETIDQKLPVVWKERTKKASGIIHRLLMDTEADHTEALKTVGGPVQPEVTKRENLKIDDVLKDWPTDL